MKRSSLVILLFLLLGICQKSIAQRGHGSLYSFFGAGTFLNSNFGMAKRLGGVGAAVRSPYFLNGVNPAALNSIEVPFTFLFEAEAAYNFQIMNTGSQSLKSNMTNLSMFQFWMRLSDRSTLSLGMMPVSQQDYSFSDDVQYDGILDPYQRTLQGWGNTNKVYLNWAFALGPRISLGIRPSFVFSNYQRSTTYLNANELGYLRENTANMSGIGIEAGVQWTILSQKDKNLTWGINAEQFGQLRGTTQGEISTYPANLLLHKDTPNPTQISLPSQVRSGLAYQTSKWLFAGDLIRGFKEGALEGHRSNWVYSAGAEWVPGYGKSGFFNAMSFSLGGWWDSGALEVKNSPVISRGVSSGVGFQLNRATRINISYQYQLTGEVWQLSKERLHSLTLNFTFGDRWFQKYTFD